MKKENWEYEAPVVEVIEVEVEKGFANSLHGTSGVGDYMPGGGSGVWPEL